MKKIVQMQWYQYIFFNKKNFEARNYTMRGAHVINDRVRYIFASIRILFLKKKKKKKQITSKYKK